MNKNKFKNIEPDNKDKGDSTINTKKGFLISFPEKKKNANANEGSGIVMAKTINSENTQHNKPNSDNNKQNNNNNNKNENHSGGKNQNQKHKKNHHRNNQNKQKNKQESQVTDSAFSGTQDKLHQKNDKNNRNENHNDKSKNAQKKQSSDNNQNKKNQHNSQQTHKNPQNNMLFQGLSPLSKDMQNSSGIKHIDISETSPDSPNLSLEEKYKNAIPLAEQIAMEEEKRKAKKAYKNQKIDRKSTANASMREKLSNADEQTDFTPDENAKYEIVGVRFREAGKIYYFDPDGKDIPYGSPVIVETARGAEYGYTAISNRIVPASNIIPPLKPIKRLATAADTEKYLANKALESDAAEIFKEKVASLGLEMSLVFVEYTFDNSKLLFYFTAETRIDFRELVKELASVFRTRIELRQIGVRDEAKILGGLGVCGRPVCCNSFLGDFAQVSIKMAKDQGLSLNSAKISGTCGKLMCCLRYEDKVYQEEMSRTPRVGSIVDTKDGQGTVLEANALKGIIKVKLDETPDAPLKTFDRTEVRVLGFNKNAIKDDTEEINALKDLEN